jgi:hypothetical protein
LVIRRCREKGVLEVLNTQELLRLSVPDGNATRTLRALRFLGLVDDDDRSTPAFARLCQASTGEYPQILAEILRAAYKDVFTIVDLTNTNLTELHDAFRHYTPQAQRSRMVRLFVGLCREAELMLGGPLESRLRGKTATTRKATALNRSPNGTPRKEDIGTAEKRNQQVGTVAFGQLASPGHVAPSKLDSLVDEYMLLTELLRKQLPQNRVWTPERREQWLKAHTAMLDLLIRVEDPENENLQSHGGDSVMPDVHSDGKPLPLDFKVTN